MTAFGIIAGEKRDDSDAWPIELDPLSDNGEPRTVVVPADWVEAEKEDSLSRKQSKKKKNIRQKSKGSMAMDEDEENFEDKDDDYEDEEEVFLETVVGGTPKPTPAQGGSIHDEDEDERQQGGVQCQQM